MIKYRFREEICNLNTHKAHKHGWETDEEGKENKEETAKTLLTKERDELTFSNFSMVRLSIPPHL